ncbi:2-hydroxyacid dehydrogenase [Microbulbifer sp. ALW1]|uniref:2-hydroxyacid dehydrogenase n=1 Tax=Microbulbifer sp. (strain ALW1) TaxID=1516059 RepID=UPI00135AAA8C|nr:2-hydroxyacid dehydrogenase [Microbulbifer sp. ALW1]
MKIAVFNAKPYDKQYLAQHNQQCRHQLVFIDAHLDSNSLPQARGAPVVSLFVNDPVDDKLIQQMSQQGVQMLALRSAGFNHVDLEAAHHAGILVANVPDYSPFAVAEHATALLLSLVRHLYSAQNRIREGNYALSGLMGFDLHGKTVGIVGTGKIGLCFARIMHGFGCKLLGSDPVENPQCKALGLVYVPLEELLATADIISLHCPLLPATHHLIDAHAIDKMRPGTGLINTARGPVIDTAAAIAGLKSGKIGLLGLDVYEDEAPLFFDDHSDRMLLDDQFARLLTFKNVLVTAHQGFFTQEAVSNIAKLTLENVTQFENRGDCDNRIRIS